MSKSNSSTLARKSARGAMGKKEGELQPVNPNAAGIDLGSREHYVAVPPDRDERPVRCFGCFTPELRRMADWLKECGIETVAMEATGVYWVPVFQILESYGFEVVLANPRYIKNVSGRDTDVGDAEWLRRLHSYGLVAGSFRPAQDICVLRSYWRQREELVRCASIHIQHMQKALDQMSLHLHKVLSDITGVTGMQIIRAIVAGERSPLVLAQMRHPQVKSSREEIAQALSGDYRQEHIFALRQALELYDTYRAKIEECDQEISRCLKTFDSKTAGQAPLPPAPKRKPRKNQPTFQLREELQRIAGVDLTRIEGIDALTAQTMIAECGLDMSRFPTEKHFASWLGLSPHNRVTGGKRLSGKTRKVDNRAATALRIAAQSLHGSQSALGAFYRRMRARLGAPKAITATAHKLARLIYRLLKYGHAYVAQGMEQYERQCQERLTRSLSHRAAQLGFQLVNQATGELVS